MIIIFWLFICCINQQGICQQSNDTVSIKKRSHFEIGLVAGTPYSISLLGGYWIDPLVFRASGMYYGYNKNGVQLNLGFEVGKKTNCIHCIGAAIGKAQDPGCDYYYLGPVYDLYYKRLYLELGPCKVIHVERGDFSDLPYWIILQVGYVYRFK
jgi:hypothetical protein